MAVGKHGKDVAALTAAALLMRLIGLLYQSWLARQIGASGLGLWQLVLSVNVLSATLAISGIRYTTTRLVSEELGNPEGGSARGAMIRCLAYALIFGCVACLITFFCAESIGFLWIGDARTVACLRLFSFTLPMISVSCVLNGCLIANGQAWKSALAQAVEQCISVCAVVLLLRRESGGDLARCCAAIARGNLLADAVSLLLTAGLLVLSPSSPASTCPPRLTGRMLHIALPLAISAYTRVGLSTLEHLLVPRKLRESGLSADGALGGYGTVTGMVFPLIAFPSCLPGAIAELTVPELTAAQMRGDADSICRTVRKLLRLTSVYALFVMLLFFSFSDILGAVIYHSASVGRWIRLLSPMIPVMYLDIVTDGCLKGLGQMIQSMRYNIGEALIGLLLVMTLLPRFAMTGYLIMLYTCELWNFGMSYSRLRWVAGLRLPESKKIKGHPDR